MPKKPIEVIIESDGTWLGTHIYNAVTRMEYDDVEEIHLTISVDHPTKGYMIRNAGDNTDILVKEYITVVEDDFDEDVELPGDRGGGDGV